MNLSNNETYNTYYKLCDQIKEYSKFFPNSDDHILANMWMFKLGSWEGGTMQELEQINEILQILLECCLNRSLTSPFNTDPPENIDLQQLINMIDRSHPKTMEQSRTSGSPELFEIRQKTTENPSTGIPELFEISPDDGAFLMEQPVPRSGVFCYLAVINRTP